MYVCVINYYGRNFNSKNFNFQNLNTNRGKKTTNRESQMVKRQQTNALDAFDPQSMYAQQVIPNHSISQDHQHFVYVFLYFWEMNYIHSSTCQHNNHKEEHQSTHVGYVSQDALPYSIKITLSIDRQTSLQWRVTMFNDS